MRIRSIGFTDTMKVAEQSVARQSSDGHATVGRLSNNFNSSNFNFEQKWQTFEQKSLNGHAIFVGGHATVGRLSSNFFSSFQAKWQHFQKSMKLC